MTTKISQILLAKKLKEKESPEVHVAMLRVSLTLQTAIIEKEDARPKTNITFDKQWNIWSMFT